jgi:hypothetical protein
VLPQENSCPATPQRREHQIWIWMLTAVWLGAAVFGLRVVWAYDNAPGAIARAPKRWPTQSALAAASDRQTLVVFAHPQCPCTRASSGELAEVLARTQRQPRTYVVFLKPREFADGWEKTGLWQTAANLPGVTVLRDDGGGEARAFGVATSGQTLLYDSRGALVFNGGITGSRGHAGDNAGRAALIALIGRAPTDRSGANVFGCPLFVSGS